jgi:hypothetical protein
VELRPGDGSMAGLDCERDDTLGKTAVDGGIAGYVERNGVRRAAYWDGANRLTVVPLVAGETSAGGVAVATGGRMVIRSNTGISFWHRGRVTPLRLPAEYGLARVVELTDLGLLVAEVQAPNGPLRPAVWSLAGR